MQSKRIVQTFLGSILVIAIIGGLVVAGGAVYYRWKTMRDRQALSNALTTGSITAEELVPAPPEIEEDVNAPAPAVIESPTLDPTSGVHAEEGTNPFAAPDTSASPSIPLGSIPGF